MSKARARTQERQGRDRVSEEREQPDSTVSALLIVDVQQALFERPVAVHRSDELLETIRGLVDRAHEARGPVAYIQHCSEMMVRGSDAWRLHGGLRPEEGDLMIEKTQGDAFEGTGLDAELRARSVSRVIVTGLITHGCIAATCLGGSARGYDVILVADGHSNCDREAAQVIAEWNDSLRPQIGGVVPAREVDFGPAG
jgi:nicotinamidase-related amidase